MTIRDFLASKMGLRRNATDDPSVLHTATYRFAAPRGWGVDRTGHVAVIRGPRGELLQISSAASQVNDSNGLAQSVEALRKLAKESLESLVTEPDLVLLEGPTQKTTLTGIQYEEVLLRAPSGDLVAGFVIHGPRTSVIATLDTAPDRSSVDVVRQSIHSIAFEGSV